MFEESVSEITGQPVPDVMPDLLPDVIGIFIYNVTSGRWARCLAHPNWINRRNRLDIEPPSSRMRRIAQLHQHLSEYRSQNLDTALYRQLVQDAELSCYLLTIHDVYAASHEQLRALQSGEPQAWEILRAQLAEQTHKILRSSRHTVNLAWLDEEDLVQRACIEILRSRFPFDVPFESWCGRLLKNQIYLLSHRAQDVHDRGWQVISLENMTDGVGEPKRDSNSHVQLVLSANDVFRLYQQRELRRMLDDALARIPSRSRRHVLESTFFMGWADDEIADQLGKSRDNVQLLRHRGLRDLRTVLDQQAVMI